MTADERSGSVSNEKITNLDWKHWLTRCAESQPSVCRGFILWFRACFIYFRTELHPTRDDLPLPLNLKNFAPELNILFYGLAAQMQLAARLVPTELLEKHQFSDYLYQLLQDEVGWPLVNRPRFEAHSADEALIQFIDLLGQFRTLTYHMSQSNHLAYPAFVVFGRMYQQRIMESNPGAWFLRYSLLPELDDIPHATVRQICQKETPPSLRARVTWTIAKFYQWLRWLDLLPAVTDDLGQLKRTFMVFILIYHEIRQLDKIWEASTAGAEEEMAWLETVESIRFALLMEMKKVVHRELVGFPEINRVSSLYTRMENSQGILRNALQQSLVALARVAHHELDGRSLFSSFQTKLEESLRLRQDLWVLKQLVRDILIHRALDRWSELLHHFRRFRNTSMKNLMYRDWRQLDEFNDQLQNVHSSAARFTLLDQLNAFLGTLLKEVNKRSVLSEHPFPYRIED